MVTSAGWVPVRRLFARRPGRNESISYWMTINREAILPGLDRKLAQFKYGLMSGVPDGFLIRVSALESGLGEDCSLHDRFIEAFAASVKDGNLFGFKANNQKYP